MAQRPRGHQQPIASGISERNMRDLRLAQRLHQIAARGKWHPR
jgi:hypothetical protein